MQPPSEEVRRELAALLEQDESLVGRVYRAREQGLDPYRIRDELGYGSAGTIFDHIAVIKTLLDGEPRTDSRARKTLAVAQTLRSSSELSTAAAAHLSGIENELASQLTESPRATKRSASPSEAESLRAQVHNELTSRAGTLIARIREEIGIDADDYNVIATADFALDAVVRLVMTQSTSRTTRALHEAGRLDLSLETAVVQWAADLPLHTELIDSARGRLAYWRSS